MFHCSFYVFICLHSVFRNYKKTNLANKTLVCTSRLVDFWCNWCPPLSPSSYCLLIWITLKLNIPCSEMTPFNVSILSYVQILTNECFECYDFTWASFSLKTDVVLSLISCLYCCRRELSGRERRVTPLIFTDRPLLDFLWCFCLGCGCNVVTYFISAVLITT